MSGRGGFPAEVRLLLSRLGLASLLILSVPRAAEGSTNVILVMADDFGYECLGCNGSRSYQTPVLDKLAAGGIRFRHCYSQPLCTPSRVQIMTGRYNFRNYRAFGYLNPDEITFGHLLREAGYRTCIAGKWQLNGFSGPRKFPGHDDPTRPDKAGFDEFCLWQLTQPRSKGERYADPLVECRGEAPVVRKDEYGPRVFTDFILDFIERNRERPFFVYYPMVLTHEPFVPTPDSEAWRGEDRHARDKKYFADMVAQTDKNIGRIVERLERLGLRENTLLLFTGDNGSPRPIVTETRSGEIRGAKGMTIDAGCHVPLIASWPGTAPAGDVSDDLIDFSDFLPTIVAAAGAKLPEDRSIDGRSFLPQLLGKAGKPREWAFVHYDPVWGNFDAVKNRFARDQRYKLYQDGRMFDTLEDPLEKRPIVDAKAVPEVRGLLQSALDSMPPWEPLLPLRR